MSDTFENTGADGIPEEDENPARMPGGPVRDEVRLDLDEESLDTWDAVRKDYALDDPDSGMARPALTEREEDDEDDVTPGREDDEEDELAEDDDDQIVHEEE